MPNEKPAAGGKAEIRPAGHDVKRLAETEPVVDDMNIERCAHCARALVPGDSGCAFEWTAKKRTALNAKHEGQFANFGDVGSWVLNGWAVQDMGSTDSQKPWILTDKGKSLTEAEFDKGVAAFFGLTFK